MTDAEIIKALEVLIEEQTDGYQTAIEYGGKRDETHELFLELMESVIAMLNRQKAKIKALEMDNNQLQSDIVNANMNADHALAEIERLSVVLCKDCKHRHKVNTGLAIWQVCHKLNRQTDDDFYCAYGER